MSEDKITVTERVYGPGPTPGSRVLLAVPGDIVTADQIAPSAGEAEEAEEPAETDDATSDREALEARANDLGVEFRANISDETLAERVAAAEAEND